VIGQTLSHFKITAKLGEGGMGAVYRAEDTKLGRDVAIKVLPEAVAQDPERLARFEREAQVLASLNHSHIAAIYQVEQDGETHFLVMELVEGEDLEERLARGPMELDDVLLVAFQAAEALVAVGVAAGGVVVRLTEEPRRTETVRLAMNAPDGWTFSHIWDWSVSSPAGDRVVFRASRDSEGGGTESSRWIRSLESMTAMPLGALEDSLLRMSLSLLVGHTDLLGHPGL
jgi:hypothetical protein